MANNGMTRRKRTTVPPKKFPTKISALSSAREFMPTEISGIEGSKPKTKKEKAKEDSFRRRENLSTAEIIRPAPSHTKTKEKIKIRTLISGIEIILPFCHV